MINSLMSLAFEANGVIALRMTKLMRGGRSARREAELMVSEKIHAAFEATASLIAGAFRRENSPSISTACSGQCEATGRGLIRAGAENVRSGEHGLDESS